MKILEKEKILNFGKWESKVKMLTFDPWKLKVDFNLELMENLTHLVENYPKNGE